LPWLKRRVQRVRGWLHFWCPDSLDANVECLFNAQIQRFRTDEISGAVVQPNLLATNILAQDETVYWRQQRHVATSSAWTNPQSTVFRGSIFINAPVKVVLDEEETAGMRLTWKVWNGSVRLYVRSRIRTLVSSG